MGLLQGAAKSGVKACGRTYQRKFQGQLDLRWPGVAAPVTSPEAKGRWPRSLGQRDPATWFFIGEWAKRVTGCLVQGRGGRRGGFAAVSSGAAAGNDRAALGERWPLPLFVRPRNGVRLAGL